MDRFVILLCLLSVFRLTAAESTRKDPGGLMFYSHQVEKERRTSCYLENDAAIHFDDYFQCDFDYRFYYDRSGHFGQICKIVLGDVSTIDMALNVRYRTGTEISILVNGKNVCSWPFDARSLNDKHWNHISFTILPEKNLLTIRNNEDSVDVVLPARYERYARIGFGANKSFSANDVASVILGDLTVATNPSKMKYHWRMRTHCGGSVVDELHGKRLIVENPYWLIDEHVKWRRDTSFVLSNCYLLMGENASVWLVSPDEVRNVDLDTRQERSYATHRAFDYRNTSNNFVFNDSLSRIEYLDIRDSLLGFSCFDTQQSRWIPEIREDQRWNIKCNTIYAGSYCFKMFGYGYHRYSDRIYRLDARTGEILDLNASEEIAPRYLSAVGRSDNWLYVASGVGNETGSQVLGTNVYCDFYAIDVRTGSIHPLSGLELPDDRIPAGNLLFVSDSLFYTLSCNPFIDNSSLQLKQVNLQARTIRSLADSIPYRFHDTTSEAVLLFSSDREKLYAVTKHDVEHEKSRITVYSIRYPVYLQAEVLQQTGKYRYWFWLPAGVFLLFVAAALWWIRRRHGTARGADLVGEPVDARRMSDMIVSEGDGEVEKPVAEIDVLQTTTRPGICFLGGFLVVDRDGVDITARFTPIMRQLFCLIALYTLKTNRGIGNSLLKDLLWMDKSDERAANNRSVNIRKIRVLLGQVGDCGLSSENSYWKLTLSEDTYFDLAGVLIFLRSFLADETKVKSASVNRLLEICEMGSLLPNLNEACFDDFKSSYASLVVDALNKALKGVSDDGLRISLANAIMKFSPLDETALEVKCMSLVALGKNGLAKSTFDKFSRNYFDLMGEEFPYYFDEVLRGILKKD